MFLLGGSAPGSCERLVWGEIQVRPVALDLSFQCDQGSITIPVAQLFLQELGAQVLDQLVAVLAWGATAQPGVTERPGELAHDLSQ